MFVLLRKLYLSRLLYEALRYVTKPITMITVLWCFTLFFQDAHTQTMKTFYLDVIVENVSNETTPVIINNSNSSCKERQPVLAKLSSRPVVKDLTHQNSSACLPAYLINTMDVYTHFNFQEKINPDNLLWTNDMEKRFRNQVVNTTSFPLKVYIVPFSHNDAGWLKTFKEYHDTQSSHILTNMVKKLQQYEDLTFVWSEISFLAEWWKSTDVAMRTDFIDLIKEGRLEVLTGGWVMPDEATTHYYALTNQLIEGHQWLKNNLDIQPKVGWSIDPFGHSTTMTYLLKVAGLTNGIVIQRVHYQWKRHFAQTKTGDFLWRQFWDSHGCHDLLTHHSPFEIYSAVKSCGPHSAVCFEFDFYLKMKSQKITFKNVKERLEILLSEYGRTGSLFEHNVVQVTLGDDFRYSEEHEWDDQYSNYKALLDYLSSVDHDYRAEIKFGTPKDYFKEVRCRMTNRSFPVLRGDFFPYSDVDQIGPQYWTGYYSTRPFWKSLDRKVEYNLRSAEILYTLALNLMRQKSLPTKSLCKLYGSLVSVRQKLSIFQHHDGITGTSKHHVMIDYLTMLLESNVNAVTVQTRSIQSILFDTNAKCNKLNKNKIPTLLLPTTLFTKFDNSQLNIEVKIIDGYPRLIVVFNPLMSWREDIVRLTISSPNVVIRDSQNITVKHQINPIWCVKLDNRTKPQCPKGSCETGAVLKISNNLFELIFKVQVHALALQTYIMEKQQVKREDKACESNKTLILTKAYKSNPPQMDNDDDLNRTLFTFGDLNCHEIELTNRELTVRIDTNAGHIKEIINRSKNIKIQCEQYYKLYRSCKKRSGAYLFRATSETIKLCFKYKFMLMIKGPIVTEFIVVYDEAISHVIKLYNTNGPLSKIVHVEESVDLKKAPVDTDVELCTRFKTDINNKYPQTFFTDANGFQILKRVYVPTVGIESNYYPVTTAIYIEDLSRRFTVLTSESHGATSNYRGSIEIMLERRIHEDDNKGMGEGVMDTQLTSINFWLLLESISRAETGPNEIPKMSLLADYLSDNLIYPTNVFISDIYVDPSYFTSEARLVTQAAPCGVHLVNLRTLSHRNIENFPYNQALMTVQRKGSSTGTILQNSTGQDINLIRCIPIINNTQVFHNNTAFVNITYKQISKVSLGGFIDETNFANLPHLSSYQLKPFEIGTFQITFV